MSTSLADRAMSPIDRLRQYDDLNRILIPGWQVEFMRATASMKKALPAASDPNGSLRDLATFILAAKASENAQCSLLAAEKIARNTHPASKMEFGS